MRGCNNSPELIWLCPDHGTCSKSEDGWDFQPCMQPMVIKILHNSVCWVVVNAVMRCIEKLYQLDPFNMPHVILRLQTFVENQQTNLFKFYETMS